MSKKRTSGIWIIILIFTAWAIFSFYMGIFSFIEPFRIIYFGLNTGWAVIFDTNPITGYPLIEILPIIGLISLLMGFLLSAAVFGLLTYKEWGWVITAIISLVLMIFIVGIILLWILDGEETKMSYLKGQ